MKETFLNALELAYDLVVRPETTLERIAGGGYWREGLAALAFSTLFPCLSALAQMEHGSVFSVAGVGLFCLGSVLLMTACTHGAARLFGGTGSFKSLAAGLFFADLPLNFATLAESLVFILPQTLVHVVSVSVMIWWFVLAVYAVRASHKFSTLRSIAALLLPAFLVVAVILVIAVYIVAGIVSTVTSL